ncbi:MAG: class I SAM-dependent methyltransferase [Verrucomicrobia bacterium]|jgi:ubiquinone/menaquinone biosynthesis C-methylase UbiE|nr:class I SAM-dependent methyltransferase [Verrucomicrobiota bacterium]
MKHFLWFLLIHAGWLALRAADPSQPTPPPAYEYRPGSFDGTGKWFLDREIAHFMSHQGAPWLEREERETEEAPNRLVSALGLKPGNQVGDVGAGSGYLTWRMARVVGPTGKIYANDIQPEMIAFLRTNLLSRGITNVVPVLGTTTDPRLPDNTLDLILLVDVYHECDHPWEMTRRMTDALKPGGRLVFVEYRGEERWIPIKPLHKMTANQVRKEMALHPRLEFMENLTNLPRQHILIFQKKASPPGSSR